MEREYPCLARTTRQAKAWMRDKSVTRPFISSSDGPRASRALHDHERAGRARSGRLRVLQQMLALRPAGILAAEAAAALQLGHDQVNELLDRAGAVDRRQHEAIAADGIEIGFELIGNVVRRARHLRQPHRLAVVARDLLER